jgi:hypothetical protein
MASSCGKLIQDQQRNALIVIMTDGQWHVKSYMEGANPVTVQFEGFNFQFNEDGTVSGDNGTGAINGTWMADIENYSIISHFPTAGEPLNKLNGTWKIKDSGLEYVVAEMKTSQYVAILHLRKTL